MGESAGERGGGSTTSKASAQRPATWCVPINGGAGWVGVGGRRLGGTAEPGIPNTHALAAARSRNGGSVRQLSARVGRHPIQAV